MVLQCRIYCMRKIYPVALFIRNKKQRVLNRALWSTGHNFCIHRELTINIYKLRAVREMGSDLGRKCPLTESFSL